MNYTNSTLSLEDKNNNTFSEAIGGLIAIIIIACIYFCFCTPSKEESEKRFKWGVNRAQRRIELRNQLAETI